MPQTSIKAGPALGIRLEGGRTAFAPGDTIAGQVFRGMHIVSTEAVIKVTLSGRVKTKVIAGPSAVYRGRTTLIDEERHVQVSFQGPLHIPPAPTPEEAERAWPFTIAIPMYTADVLAEQSPPAGHMARQILPGTFTMDRTGLGAQDEAFIEYAVKAELQSSAHGSVETTDAILPITIRTASLEPPIVDFQLTRHRLYGCISSYRLLPEVGRAGPSFSQKARSLLGSLKVPAFAGHMEIDTPAVIQLEHPSPIPLRFRFVPDANVLRGSRIEDVPQKIQLLMLSMEIRAATEISGDGASGPRSAVSPAVMSISAWSRVALGPGTPPLYIPCAGEGPPVDVGQRVNLRLGYSGLMSKAFAQGNIHPSFATRYLKYTHRIHYKLSAIVAEEELKFRWGVDVTILPSAGTSEEHPPPPFEETWIRPPPGRDAPPQSIER
ncbi:hypothetical protein EDB80DRAFT_319223 [Ilyonectria destructans]|nr:hypothetical protein EDB80DRAFT_319223 [Ilyonectria destructans]